MKLEKVEVMCIMEESRPAWGAWIEIPPLLPGLPVLEVAPRVGRVD